MKTHYFPLGGGIDRKTSITKVDPGKLLQGVNIEQKVTGGYARILGYSKFDSTVVPGEGAVRGVWRFGSNVYAFRKDVGVGSVTMYTSTGSGWTSVKTGLGLGDSYEFVNHNFGSGYYMYGTTGADPAFQYNGSVYTPITSANLPSPNTPRHIIKHKKHLFLSFGPKLIHSGLGDPLTYTALTGAAEILVDSGITGLMQLTGGVLGVLSREGANILTGSTGADWNVDNFDEHGVNVGNIEFSLQQLGSRVYFLNDRGITDLATSDKFGDFADATMSYEVNDILLKKKGQVTASCVVKDKSQYRLFFSDGTGMIFTIVGDKVKGITEISFPDVVRCVASVEDDNGDEVIYFGSDSGYVYQMEDGNSFDGTAIPAFMRLAYNHIKSPRLVKRFRRASFDMQSEAVDISVLAKPSFEFESDGVYPDAAYTGIETNEIGSILGVTNIGDFILSTNYIQDGSIDMPGRGSFVSLLIFSESIEAPWEIDGITYSYETGRTRR